METVNNLAAAASKAIWGDPNASTTENKVAGTGTESNETQGKEPLSGVQGDVAKGEPFDKGNVEAEPTPTEDVLAATEISPLKPAGEQSSSSAEPIPTEDVIATTKVLPLRPAGDKPTSAEEESSSSTSEQKKDKDLPNLPNLPTSITTATNLEAPGIHTSDLPESSTPHSHPPPSETMIKPTPFAGLKDEPASPIGGSESSDRKGSGLGLEDKLGAVADTTKVQGQGGKRLDEESLATGYGGSNVGVEEQAEEAVDLPGAGKKQSEPTSPTVPSKISSSEGRVSEDAGVDGKEGKEKLSLKEKIKAKLHHKH